MLLELAACGAGYLVFVLTLARFAGFNEIGE